MRLKCPSVINNQKANEILNVQLSTQNHRRSPNPVDR